MTKKLDANYRENESKFNRLEVPTPGLPEAGKVLMVGEDGKLMYGNIEIPSGGLRPHVFSTVKEVFDALKDKNGNFLFQQKQEYYAQYILTIQVSSSNIEFKFLTIGKSGSYDDDTTYVDIGFASKQVSGTSTATSVSVDSGAVKRIIGNSTAGLTVEAMRYNRSIPIDGIIFWYED